jgi:hypothetical protein
MCTYAFCVYLYTLAYKDVPPLEGHTWDKEQWVL